MDSLPGMDDQEVEDGSSPRTDGGVGEGPAVDLDGELAEAADTNGGGPGGRT